MAGVGGKGVLTAGLLMAQAGMSVYPHVLWFPSYQSAKRGGPCECSVILSMEEIASPVLSQSETLFIMDKSQLKPFIGRLCKGGLLIIDSTGFNEEISRDDIQIVKVPAIEIAVGMQNLQSSNLILLGAYLGLKQVIPVSKVEEQLKNQFSGKEQQLTANIEALHRGTQIAADYINLNQK